MEDIVTCKCTNEMYSTTRKLTRVQPEVDPCGHTPLIAEHENKGGLRTNGLYKSDKDLPLITVITIALNCASSIQETILSVLNQTYSNIEYIIIDGGSADGTLDIIKRYEHAIDYWVSEPDRGIYDAMNKGIKLSTGKWLNFLNVKDVFVSDRTIRNLVDNCLQSGARFIYSDILLTDHRSNNDRVIRQVCDHKRHIINHQGSLYQKNLHLEYGLYAVAKGLTISDYLFFCLIDQRNFLKADDPIAKYDTTGISQSKASVGQKFVVDYLLNGMPKYQFLLRFCFTYYHIWWATKCIKLLRPIKTILVGNDKIKNRFSGTP